MGMSPCVGGKSPYSSKFEKFTHTDEGSKAVCRKPVSRRLLSFEQSPERSPNIYSCCLWRILSHPWRNIITIGTVIETSKYFLKAHILTLSIKGRPSDWWLSVSCPPNLRSEIRDWLGKKIFAFHERFQSLPFSQLKLHANCIGYRSLYCRWWNCKRGIARKRNWMNCTFETSNRMCFALKENPDTKSVQIYMYIYIYL